jgi:hypothetical protein
LLITEGSTSTIFPDYHLVSGVTIEETTGLFARGVVLKSEFVDKNSPIAYGYDSNNLAVYFSSGPVINAGGAGAAFGAFGGGGRGGPPIPGVGMNLTPNAIPQTLARLDQPPAPATPAAGRGGRGGAPPEGAPPGGGGGRGGAGAAVEQPRPRVILRFPADPNDMLLSGGLVGQQALVGRAVVVDSPLGKGHVVMFSNRPFWRYETHGSFNLAFNAILNWNHLDAGAQPPQPRVTTNEQQ